MRHYHVFPNILTLLVQKRHWEGHCNSAEPAIFHYVYE